MARPLAADTPADVERRQIERWRTMTTAEKVALISGVTNASFEMARAGIRHRHPHASPREQFRLAIVTLGPELAGRAYCWYAIGGGTSDRQWRDVQGILRVQGARLDLAYLRQNAPALGVQQLLADALAEATGRDDQRAL
jgi:hypothetical protein